MPKEMKIRLLILATLLLLSATGIVPQGELVGPFPL